MGITRGECLPDCSGLTFARGESGLGSCRRPCRLLGLAVCPRRERVVLACELVLLLRLLGFVVCHGGGAGTLGLEITFVAPLRELISGSRAIFRTGLWIYCRQNAPAAPDFLDVSTREKSSGRFSHFPRANYRPELAGKNAFSRANLSILTVFQCLDRGPGLAAPGAASQGPGAGAGPGEASV